MAIGNRLLITDFISTFVTKKLANAALYIPNIFLFSVVCYSSNAAAAECVHVVTNNWGSRFQAQIQITNTDSTPITNRTLTWSYV